MNLWTDEQDSELRKMVAAGKSISIAAAALGRSRTAVQGRAGRLGLRFAGGKPKLKARRILVHNLVNKKLSRLADPGLEPRAEEQRDGVVRLLDLKPRHCRFPIGDPTKPDFGFCGADRSGASAYCDSHHRLCYTPRQSRAAA